MRISRLLAITTYLLNRNIVTGKSLAEKFEVSERTIQRDIEAINMAGIPSITNQDCKIRHIAEERLFEDLMANDSRKYMDIKLSCNKEAMYVIKEYMPNCTINKLRDEKYICEINIPENERMWYGILLSL